MPHRSMASNFLRNRRRRVSPLDLSILALVVVAFAQLLYWDQFDTAPLYVDHGAWLADPAPKHPGETFWIVRDWEQYATPKLCNRSLVDHGVIPMPSHGSYSERGRHVSRFPVTLPDWMPAGKWAYHVECLTDRNPLHTSELTSFADVTFEVTPP